MDKDRCDIVTFQPVGIVDHIIVVEDETAMKRMLDEDEIGGSHPISAKKMESILSEEVGSIESKPGGSASNMLRNLAQLGGGGTRCRIVGGIGDDTWGRLFHTSMEDRGIDTRYLRVKEGNTGCCCVITCGNTRTMRTMFDAAATFGVADLERTYFQGAKVLFVSAYCFYHQGLVEKMIEMGREEGCMIALDMASFEIVRRFAKEIQSILPYIDVCFCNEDESRECALLADPDASDPPREGAQYLFENGVQKAVIVTLGEKGCLLFVRRKGDTSEELNASLSVTRVRGYRVDNVVDTTGAGDAFSAGFLWSFLQGYDLVRCLEIGNLTGAAVIQSLGSDISDDKLTWLRKRMSTYI